MKINKKIIKELSDYLDEFNLTELEYTEKDTKIKVSKNNVSINNQSIPIPKNDTSVISISKASNEKKSGIEVTSPIIGEVISVPDFVLFEIFGASAEGGTILLDDNVLLSIETLFLDTFIFVSFSVYSNSVKLNSSR